MTDVLTNRYLTKQWHIKLFHVKSSPMLLAVILMGVNERNVPSEATETYPFNGMDALEKKEYLSSKRTLLFVAITRLRGLAYMVGYGEPCGLVACLIE